MLKHVVLGGLAAMIATGAVAQSISDQVIAGLQSQGFDRFEVENGPSQVKIEAVRGNRELELVYDSRTGELLKREEGPADGTTRPGVRVRSDDRDFVRGRGSDDSPSSALRTGGTASGADPISGSVIEQLRGQGYDGFEVRRGPNQVKIEAVRGGRELELVYDIATGALLKQEEGIADGDNRPGVRVRGEDRDFVRDGRGGRFDDDDRRDRDDDRDDDRRDRDDDREDDRRDRDDDRRDRDDDRDDDRRDRDDDRRDRDDDRDDDRRDRDDDRRDRDDDRRDRDDDRRDRDDDDDD